MNYDDNTALFLKMEINRLIQFYNTATNLQQKLIRKQLKVLKLLLKINQYYLRKNCKKSGHCYTGWIQFYDKSFHLSPHFKKYKFVRICHYCGYSKVRKIKYLDKKENV